MKRILLFFSVLVLSIFIVNNNSYAQEYPGYLMKATYLPYLYNPIATNANTYEYEITYTVNVMLEGIGANDYFLVNDTGIPFRRGIDRRTNSYTLKRIRQYPENGYSTIEIHVTLLKNLVEEYADDPDYPLDAHPIFNNYVSLYIKYVSDTGSIDYDSGYYDGHEDGYMVGYEDGINDGYRDGYNDGYDNGLVAGETVAYEKGYQDGANKSFMGTIDKWLVPSIIITMLLGGFFAIARRKRDGDI